MEPREKNSSTAAGIAAYKHDKVHVYVAGEEPFELLGPYTFTNTRRDGGFDLPGYSAYDILKLFSDLAKLL